MHVINSSQALLQAETQPKRAQTHARLCGVTDVEVTPTSGEGCASACVVADVSGVQATIPQLRLLLHSLVME
jgi:hypothetical protein